MNVQLVIDYYEKNNLPKEELSLALHLFEQMNLEFDLPTEEALETLIHQSYRNKESDITFFIQLMRLMKIAKQDTLYVYLTRYTGILDVLENIFSRFQQTYGSEELKVLLEGLTVPTLGMNPKVIPQFTSELMIRLEKKFPFDDVQQLLTGNNHSLSKASQLDEKLRYEEAPTFEVYLKERHERKIAELQRHLDNRTVWFEQIITQEVIDYVKSNQEILSGRIENNKLYITKIPYDTLAYLNAKSDDERRYHGCHCSFAKESILNKGSKISGNWCYCSAGFAKFPFEIIFDQKLPIKVLNNCLDGDPICRFEIDLDAVSYKK